MLTDMPNTQTISDLIKGFILDAEVANGFRRVILRMLTTLENLPWVPLAMEEALTRVPGLQLVPTISFAGPDDDALEAIDKLIREYEGLVQPQQEYTSEEAAHKLHIKIDQFNKYTQSGRIKVGRWVGSTRLFTASELQRFEASRRPRGRQRQVT